MSPHRIRFVTLSQQLLALGVVFAALVPATRVVSLDVVAGAPPPAHAITLHQRHWASPAWSAAHPLRHRDRVAALW